jgi:hypothetical protein
VTEAAPDDASPVRSTWSGVFSFLGTVGSAMTVVSIVRNGVDVSLWGTPAVIYDGYQAYRDFVFGWVPIHLPWVVKDIVLLYVMLAAALFRTYESFGLDAWPSDMAFPPAAVAVYYAGMAAAWPLVLGVLIVNHRDAGEELRTFTRVVLTIITAAAAYFWWNHASR